MVKRCSGHIVNLSSIAGKEAYSMGNVYCASKHAVQALTQGMRIDLVKHGIKVSSVAPGAVETEFSMGPLSWRRTKSKRCLQRVYSSLCKRYRGNYIVYGYASGTCKYRRRFNYAYSTSVLACV